MQLHELQPVGTRKRPKRVGRGIGSGHGKTAGRGHKGQKARAGGGVRRGFEGGQMPLVRRLPKRGFTNIFKKKFSLVNVKQLERFAPGTLVTPDLLQQEGMVRDIKDGVKILGDGELSSPLTVRAHAFSASAVRKIEAAGGRAEVI